MLNVIEAEKQNKQEEPQERLKLDDARRVKVLSPGMMVFKRFIRNKLAVTGIIIIAIMFLFSFVGPIFSPYARAQMFTKEVEEWGDYATGKYNEESRFLGETTTAMNSAILKALGSQKSGKDYKLEAGQEIPFSAKKEHYSLRVINPSPTAPSCAIYGTVEIAKAVSGEIQSYDEEYVDAGLLAVLAENAEQTKKGKELEYNGQIISIESNKIEATYYATAKEPMALSTYNIYSALFGKTASLQADTEFIRSVNTAIHANAESVEYNGKTYGITGSAEEGFVLTAEDGSGLFDITRAYRSNDVSVTPVDENGKEGDPVEVDFVSTLSDADAFRAALNDAIAEGGNKIVFDDVEYALTESDGELFVITEDEQLAMTVSNNFDPVESKYDLLHQDFRFALAAEQAIYDGAETFEYDGETYTLISNGADYTVRNTAGDDSVLISDIAYGSAKNGIELTVDFLMNLQNAMRGKQTYFNFVNQYGEDTEARITIVNGNYYVQTMQKASLLMSRAAPTEDHLLGTDTNGMDVFTRLMYGGQISLLVGFVVVFFEIIIGVIVGGISGYFGGIVDTFLMRFVELFNAIPFYPMVIILGSVMDAQQVDPYTRLMLLMVVLGVLGWTGIARIVRGQILSLREQDFMIATEATGIRTGRRIFRHLIPNVMPLLIVYATAGLGGVIITEATLGFLGLGVKYPMASWGSIINQATDMQVMTTAWWIWIPSGMLILLTVLGFNFVGDGLRDAFDPKMKR